MPDATAEATALLEAIRLLIPFADPGPAVAPLRAVLVALVGVNQSNSGRVAAPSVRGEQIPPKPRAHSSPPRLNGLPWQFRKREDPEWPGLLARLRQAMTVRNVTKAALAGVAGIPVGTLTEYLGKRVPPPEVKAKLVRWLDQPAQEVAASVAPFPGRPGPAEAAARA